MVTFSTWGDITPQVQQFIECMIRRQSDGMDKKTSKHIRRRTAAGGLAGGIAGMVIGGPAAVVTWGLGTAIGTRAMICSDEVDLFGD